MQCSPGPHQTVKGNGIKENRLRGKILCPHIVNAAAVPFICKGNRQRVRNPKTLKIYFQSLFFEKNHLEKFILCDIWNNIKDSITGNST